MAQIPADACKAELLNCGHPPPLLANAAGAQFTPRDPARLPLGLAGLADVPLRQMVVPLTPGDQLLLYTGRVSEARDRAGEYFPLASSPSLRSAVSPETALTQLSGELVRHVVHPRHGTWQPGAGHGACSAQAAYKSVTYSEFGPPI